MEAFLLTAKRWFYNFMHVQLFLSLISLPVLVAWGLPFSLLTVFGNLIFTPFLFSFLLLATLIFFCELLRIPNQWLIFVLEKIVYVWTFCLQQGSTGWLYGINMTGLILCLPAAVIACIILHHKQWGREQKSWVLFTGLLLSPFIYQKIYSFIPKKGTIACIKRQVFVASNKGKLSITDYGAFGEKKSASTWIQYTFLPELLKTYGTIQCDKVRCAYPNARTLQALTALCEHAPVKSISLVHPARQSKEYKQQYAALTKVTQKQKIVLNATSA